MSVVIDRDDLLPFAPEISTEQAEAMITGTLARAALIAPCITDPDFPYADAAKSILVRVIVRWHDAGAGNVTSVTKGPFGETRTLSRELFWPSELTELQNLCRSSSTTTSTALPTGSFPESPRGTAAYDRLWVVPR